MKKHTVLNKILLFIIIASIILGIRLSGLGDYLTFENLKLNREHLHVFVSEH